MESGGGNRIHVIWIASTRHYTYNTHTTDCLASVCLRVFVCVEATSGSCTQSQYTADYPSLIPIN